MEMSVVEKLFRTPNPRLCVMAKQHIAPSKYTLALLYYRRVSGHSTGSRGRTFTVFFKIVGVVGGDYPKLTLCALKGAATVAPLLLFSLLFDIVMNNQRKQE